MALILEEISQQYIKRFSNITKILLTKAAQKDLEVPPQFLWVIWLWSGLIAYWWNLELAAMNFFKCNQYLQI